MTIFVLGYLQFLYFMLDAVQVTIDGYFLRHPSASVDYGMVQAVWIGHMPFLLTVPIGLLVAFGWRWVQRRRLEYTTQWWLGEVARIVHEAYDVEWSLVAQATRYLPVAWGPRILTPRPRMYRLRVAESGWLGPRVDFEIRVPARGGKSIEVLGRTGPRSGLVWIAPARSASKRPYVTG